MFPVAATVGVLTDRDMGVQLHNGVKTNKLNNFTRLLVTSVVVDLLLTIGFILGILAKVGVIPNVPLEAAYTMIALGGFTLGANIVLDIVLVRQGVPPLYTLQYQCALVRAAVSSDPKSILNDYEP